MKSAEEESNYDVITEVCKIFNPVADAKVQADGKSVLLTLSDAYRVSTDIGVSGSRSLSLLGKYYGE